MWFPHTPTILIADYFMQWKLLSIFSLQSFMELMLEPDNLDKLIDKMRGSHNRQGLPLQAPWRKTVWTNPKLKLNRQR